MTVPAGRLFLLGDNRGDSMDSRFFAADHAGTVPDTAVLGRVTAHPTGLVVLLGLSLLGLWLTAVGLLLAVAAWIAGRRGTRPPPPPLPARPGTWPEPGPA